MVLCVEMEGGVKLYVLMGTVWGQDNTIAENEVAEVWGQAGAAKTPFRNHRKLGAQNRSPVTRPTCSQGAV